MEIGLYQNLPPLRGGPQAGFQGIFQKVGQHQAHIDLVCRKGLGQVNFGLEGDGALPGQGAVIAHDAVHRRIVGEPGVQIGNAADGLLQVFLDFFQVPGFGQYGELTEMMAHVVAGLPGLFNGRPEAFIALLLQEEEVVFLLQFGVFVQIVRHHQKHSVEQGQQAKQHQTHHEIDLQHPARIQGDALLWGDIQVQDNEHQGHDPEEVPGSGEIFVLDQCFGPVCGGIVGNGRKKPAQ